MTIQFSPGRSGMPPPVTDRRRRVKLVNEGDGKYRLEDTAGVAAGWIRGHTVGLESFRTVAEAASAVPTLHQMMDVVLQQYHPEWPRREVNYGVLRLVHDGAYEWIAAGNVPLARVYRRAATASPNDSVSVELVLPSYAREATIVAAARAIAERRQEQSSLRPEW